MPQTYKLKRAALVGAASGPADASREQAHILRGLDEYAVLLQLNIPTAKCQGARQAAHLRAGGDLAAFTLHPHLSDVRHGCRTEQLGFRVPKNPLLCKRRKRFGLQANLAGPLVNENRKLRSNEICRGMQRARYRATGPVSSEHTIALERDMVFVKSPAVPVHCEYLARRTECQFSCGLGLNAYCSKPDENLFVYPLAKSTQ